jgi:hypothetical protein
MSGWGCPHESKGQCLKVPGKACDPGMKGCTLFGKYTFSSDEKNISRRLKKENKEIPSESSSCKQKCSE